MTDERRQTAKNVAMYAATSSVGAAVAFALIEVLRERPEVIVQLLTAFGPMFLVVLSMMYLVDKHAGKFVETQTQNAVATQRMAVAIETIARKDEEKDREMELVIGRLARNSDQILKRMVVIEAHCKREATETGFEHS